MIWIYKFIWDLEKRMVVDSFCRPLDNSSIASESSTNSSQRRQKFAKRAILYVGACYVTWFFLTILQQVTLAISGKAHYSFRRFYNKHILWVYLLCLLRITAHTYYLN